jgi:hypothetical protein
MLYIATLLVPEKKNERTLAPRLVCRAREGVRNT